jgi:hypothetical protein
MSSGVARGDITGAACGGKFLAGLTPAFGHPDNSEGEHRSCGEGALVITTTQPNLERPRSQRYPTPPLHGFHVERGAERSEAG